MWKAIAVVCAGCLVGAWSYPSVEVDSDPHVTIEGAVFQGHVRFKGNVTFEGAVAIENAEIRRLKKELEELEREFDQLRGIEINATEFDIEIVDFNNAQYEALQVELKQCQDREIGWEEVREFLQEAGLKIALISDVNDAW